MKSPVELRFSLASLEAGLELLTRWKDRSALRETAFENLSVLYDSFDWRLHRRGLWLIDGESITEPRERQLLLLDEDGRRLCHAPHPSPRQPPTRGKRPPTRQPATGRVLAVDDLPSGPLAERVAPLLDGRVLLPLVLVRRRGRVAEVLDRRGKTVARIYSEVLQVKRCRGPWRPHLLDKASGRFKSLGCQLRLEPIRGYDREAKKLERWLEKQGNLAPVGEGPEELRLFEAAGLEPGDYSSRLDFDLEPEERADVAIRRLLQRLLWIVETNEQGLRERLDPEFLHDFRVSVRRSRSLLTQMKKVFPKRDRARLLSALRWLQKATNRMRDLDVFRLEMPHYRARVSSELSGALEPFEELLADEAIAEHRALVRKLDSARYRRALETWRTFVDTATPKRTRLPNAARPVRDVASTRIWKVYRKVLERGRRIDDDSPESEVHDLRLEAKKLRYLLESFRSLYPTGPVRREIRALKDLQRLLGDFNDCAVQRASLAEFAEQLEARDAGPTTQQAIGQLIDRLAAGQQQARDEVGKRFSRFSEPRHKKAFKKLFAR